MSTGKAVIVMGGTSAVGACIATHLAHLGHSVVVLGPVSADASGSRSDSPSSGSVDVQQFRVEIDDIASFTPVMAAAHKALGRVDVLINALDHDERIGLDGLTPQNWSTSIDHNLKAVFFASQAVVPYMREEGGIILNLSSARGQLAAVDQLAYASAKAGVAAMTRDLATDLGRYGIKCNSVLLGIDQQTGVLSQDPPGSADVCETVEFLISDGAYVALDAFDYPVDGGITLQRDRVADRDPSSFERYAEHELDDLQKVAVITGAASGLGAEAARIFARRGLRIAVLDVLDDQGEEVAAQIRNEEGAEDAAYFHCDIADTANVTAAIDEVATRFGRIDILLNSAAITSRKRTSEITESDWDQFMAIDLWGPFITTMAAVPHMRAAGGGRVINFSSMLSTLSHGRHSLYGGAKEAMNSMTRAMAAGLKEDNIQVVSVLPAYVITPMISFRLQDQEWLDRNFEQSLSRILLYPEHVSDVFFHLAVSESDAANGHKIYVDTGYLNFRYKLVPWHSADEEGDSHHG